MVAFPPAPLPGKEGKTQNGLKDLSESQGQKILALTALYIRSALYIRQSRPKPCSGFGPDNLLGEGAGEEGFQGVSSQRARQLFEGLVVVLPPAGRNMLKQFRT